jgi:hypothetical protein
MLPKQSADVCLRHLCQGVDKLNYRRIITRCYNSIATSPALSDDGDMDVKLKLIMLIKNTFFNYSTE